MSELFFVNDPNYWACPVKPRGYLAWTEMYEGTGGAAGLWEVIQFNPRTREIVQRIWNPQIVTDQGANYMLQRAFNSSSASLPALFNNLLITNNSGSTTLTTALTSSSNYTSLSVAALPAAIPSGTTLQIGFGTGTTQNVTTSGSTAQGATSITVSSFTANASYSIGAKVVPVPQVTDNPSSGTLTSNASSPLTAYSGNLSTGAFTYTPTTGTGNRTALGQFEFDNATNGGSTSNGIYTDIWAVNVSSGATTNNYLDHAINNQMTVDNSNSILAKLTIKI